MDIRRNLCFSVFKAVTCFLVLFVVKSGFCAWPPLPNNHYLDKIGKDHNGQGYNVYFVYRNSEDYNDWAKYHFNQSGYLYYYEDSGEHDSTNRPNLNCPISGYVDKLTQEAIDVYLAYQGKAGDANYQTPLSIETTFNNQSGEQRIVRVYVDGELRTEFSSDMESTSFRSEIANLNNTTSHSVEWKDNEGNLIGSVTVPAGWDSDEFAYGTVTFEAYPFYHEIESPFDNDAPSTELPVPEDWYPDDWEYPESEDLPDDSLNPPDFDDLPESEPPDDVDRDSTQWEPDNDIPNAPQSLNDNDSDITQQDLYEAVYKALNDSGKKYDFDELNELDNEALDNDGGLIFELENTSAGFTGMLQNNRTAFNKLNNKLDDIHTLNLPKNIGTVDTIDFTIPVLQETYSIDLTAFADNINLFRSTLLFIFGIINWITAIKIIRQGIS